METVNLKIYLLGSYCNDWPRFQLLQGKNVIWDGLVVDEKILDIDLDCANSTQITLRHLDKRFGENGIWDTTTDQDRYIKVKDIKFDEVSIGQELLSSLMFHNEWSDHQRNIEKSEFIDRYSHFCSNGLMSFNGSIDIKFELPIYNWLITKKFKVPKVDAAYFSNYSLRWHYDRDLELIKEIKELMKLD